jgi:alkaline phosphatase
MTGMLVLGLVVPSLGWSAPIRNVILCIGDGMGPEQVKAAHCYAGTNLVFETFPYQSRLTTASADGEVTDSAAAATALSTGCKVYNGVLALAYPGDGSELETLLEHFSKLDKSTGLVTTSYLTDATPAGFGAHEPSRGNHVEIANDYFVQTRPNVLLGGGGYGMDPLAAEAAGYRVVTNAASLLELRGRPGDQPVAGLFGEGPLPYVYDGLGDLPSLPQMVDVALGRLVCDPDGFFLMVEGGRIDHACHGNDLERCVAEALAFDEAVRVVVAWAAGRSDTLVVVTADHETGGLTVLADNGRGFLPDVSWGTGYHTATPVPVYGVGVNASQVASLSDNTGFRGVACSAALMPATGFRIERETAGLTRTQWAVNRGDVCRVEYTPTLMPPAWQASGTVTSFGTRVVCETTNGAPCAQGFYRMITIQSGE